MYDTAARQRALDLHASGLTFSQVSRATGISRYAVRQWTTEPNPRKPADCPVPSGRPSPSVPRADYGYLLGLYLGDGCISEGRRSVHALRIACGDAWPGLIDECERAMATVMPRNKVTRVRAVGHTSLVSTSKHWPCLFPQHGPGPKHRRRIALEPWQQEIVDAHPWEFLRGLIHSDGCRFTNWTTRTVGGVQKRYEYPRYFFTNTSTDIVRLFTDTLDSVGVRWKSVTRPTGTVNVSVARKACVALMDAHIGPKH
ncbi:helix-turn-helix domain-containing protein [Kitasatospora purpeofusca]|uniref:helix-turn-helix domain-containing protein n=1 Tax=Kitasatospora purpeofusca TaxID=67352 RepID=UPI00225075C1|nr:helix-turn-helix domain-containing protein [Kitasatospora purpeofusca]MCX4685009.1 helix-turn-helix domain-containing protein [Kitasatospora purpeofusca]